MSFLTSPRFLRGEVKRSFTLSLPAATFCYLSGLGPIH